MGSSAKVLNSLTVLGRIDQIAAFDQTSRRAKRVHGDVWRKWRRALRLFLFFAAVGPNGQAQTGAQIPHISGANAGRGRSAKLGVWQARGTNGREIISFGKSRDKRGRCQLDLYTGSQLSSKAAAGIAARDRSRKLIGRRCS